MLSVRNVYKIRLGCICLVLGFLISRFAFPNIIFFVYGVSWRSDFEPYPKSGAVFWPLIFWTSQGYPTVGAFRAVPFLVPWLPQ